MNFTNNPSQSVADPTDTNWSDIITLAICSLVAGSAMFLTQFALVLHMQSSGYGGMAVAAVIISVSLPLAVLSPLTGRMADRFDSRTLMFSSAILQAGAIFAVAQSDSIPAMVGFATLSACGTAMLNPTAGALVPKIAKSKDVPRAIGANQTGMMLGMLVGPPMAGIMVGQFSLQAALYLAVGLCLLRSIMCLDIRTRRGGIRRQVETIEAKQSQWTMRNDKVLFITVASAAAALGLVSAVNVAEVFLIRETYGASETLYGFLNMPWLFAMVFGAWFIAGFLGKLSTSGRVAYVHLAIIGAQCLIIAMLGLPWPTVFALIPFLFIGGFLNAGANSAMAIGIARRVSDQYRGRATARAGAMIHSAVAVGFVTGGVLEMFLSPRAMYVSMGLVGFAIIMLVFPKLRQAVRKEETPQVPDPVEEAERIVTPATINPSQARAGDVLQFQSDEQSRERL